MHLLGNQVPAQTKSMQLGAEDMERNLPRVELPTGFGNPRLDDLPPLRIIAVH